MEFVFGRILKQFWAVRVCKRSEYKISKTGYAIWSNERAYALEKAVGVWQNVNYQLDKNTRSKNGLEMLKLDIITPVFAGQINV